MLTTELEELVSHLVELNRPVVSVLLPGVDAAQVEAVLGALAPRDVVEWFGWCNGVGIRQGQIQDDVNVVPGYSPVSIDEAIRLKNYYADDSTLGDNWTPLLANAGGDIYAAVWRSEAPSAVAGVLVGEPTEIEFTSIVEMVSVFNACFRRGAYTVDTQGRFAMDPDLYDEVYGEYRE